MFRVEIKEIEEGEAVGETLKDATALNPMEKKTQEYVKVRKYTYTYT